LENNDYLYCRYFFTFGDDWEILGGLDNGLSQIACHNHLSVDGEVVWNFPVDISFKATNIHGWPRIAVGVYGIDFFGRDVIRGYGSALVPMQSGLHKVKVEMYKPIANSALNQLASWIMGNPPEFFDLRFVSQSEGREVSRVQHSGHVDLSFQVNVKGMLTLPNILFRFHYLTMCFYFFSFFVYEGLEKFGFNC
jgi:B9 domain-containing protein 1